MEITETFYTADRQEWRHWQSFSPPYRRIRAACVDTARDRGAPPLYASSARFLAADR